MNFWETSVYAFFASLNAVVITEDITNHGQADMTVMLGDFIYIMEIKLDKSTDYQVQMPNSALQQIQDKAYAQKYLGQGKKVIEVGFIFNQVQRNLVQLDWLS